MKKKSIFQYNYYLTEFGLLISHCIQTGLYRAENTTQPNTILTKDFFLQQRVKIIKRQKFKELLNVYFKNVNDSWEYDNQKFKKLPNFENTRGKANWQIIEGYPVHEIANYCSALKVYYHGRLYYFALSGNYFPHGQLYDIYTKETNGMWTDIKNVAPIYNITLKKII